MTRSASKLVRSFLRQCRLHARPLVGSVMTGQTTTGCRCPTTERWTLKWALKRTRLTAAYACCSRRSSAGWHCQWCCCFTESSSITGITGFVDLMSKRAVWTWPVTNATICWRGMSSEEWSAYYCKSEDFPVSFFSFPLNCKRLLRLLFYQTVVVVVNVHWHGAGSGTFLRF